MITVYKYPIYCNSLEGRHHPIKVTAHRGAIPLHVGLDEWGSSFLWMEVNTSEPIEDQTPLVCIGTGHGCVPSGYTHFQSLQEEKYVWHLYRKA